MTQDKGHAKNGKNVRLSSFLEPKKKKTSKLGMRQRGIEPLKICSFQVDLWIFHINDNLTFVYSGEIIKSTVKEQLKAHIQYFAKFIYSPRIRKYINIKVNELPGLKVA